MDCKADGETDCWLNVTAERRPYLLLKIQRYCIFYNIGLFDHMYTYYGGRHFDTPIWWQNIWKATRYKELFQEDVNKISVRVNTIRNMKQ